MKQLISTRLLRPAAAAALVATVIAGLPAGAALPVLPDPTAPPGRQTEPIVLTGASFPGWAAPADAAVKLNTLGGAQCQGLGSTCTHNTYEPPDASTQALLPQAGVPVDRLRGYRWNPKNRKFQQIPFQVDEMFVRYLSNNNSGFAFYSETDQHTSYAFDREGFRWTESDAGNPCLARPGDDLAVDPVPGLDRDDELVFMADDAGAQAPPDAPLPKHAAGMIEVAVTDPTNAATAPRYVYVVLAGDKGPDQEYDAGNGYVRYQRDPDADVFLYSQSSYGDYGAAPAGPYFDPATGTCVTDTPKQRRPGDQATVTTPRYRFRYDGRWLMTQLQVSADDDWTYGPDLVDQWKARAFQQRPGGQTPCCGYEEEVNNWGGSSILMGERWGPVRVIRETWGADSGTNVVRREVFYRDEIRFGSFLRVHPIPPLDGIYVQWDYNAGIIDRYYNPHVPDGVAVDGQNDEVFGNSRVHVGPDGVSYDGSDTVSDDLRERNDGQPLAVGQPDDAECKRAHGDACIYNDIDTPDPTFSGANGLLQWEQVSGPHGTLVTRWSSTDVTPGGAAHAVAAAPYYRDDACFDDGTGADPGPHVRSRGVDEGEHALWTDDDGVAHPRDCYDHATALEDDAYRGFLGTRRFYQGSIGTHGLHLLLIADSDNAFTTLPVTEINSEQRMVVLPPVEGNVGESYGRAFERPLLALTAPRG